MKKLFTAAAVLALALPAFARNDALSLVPNDAASVGVVRLSDLRSSPIGSMLFKQTDQVSTNGDAEKFLQDAGLKPSQDVDVVVVAMTPKGTLAHDADVLVAMDGRFNVDRLTSALVARGAVKKGAYFLLPQGAHDTDTTRGAVAFPDAHLAVVGSETAVANALATRAAGGSTFFTSSGLGRESARIEPHATAWALVDVQRAQRISGGPHMPEHNPSAQAMSSAMKNMSTVALWATDTGSAVKLGAFGVSGDTETLQLLEDTMRGALSAMRLAVQDKQPDLVPVLRHFTVSRTNDTVSVSGSVPAETFKSWAAKTK